MSTYAYRITAGPDGVQSATIDLAVSGQFVTMTFPNIENEDIYTVSQPAKIDGVYYLRKSVLDHGVERDVVLIPAKGLRA